MKYKCLGAIALLLFIAFSGCMSVAEDRDERFVMAGQEQLAEDVAGGNSPYGSNKLVALTFDDGPGPYTDQLLDELGKRGAKATFFLFGSKIDEDNRHLVRRMEEEGHCVGSHTYSHARLTTLSDADIWEELEKADRAIEAVTGIVPQLLRPPFGAYDQRVMDAVAKPIILWSLDTRDWELDDPKTVSQNILDSVGDGDIVLLHELALSSKDGVVAAMDIMIDEGYSFVTVPELFELRGIALEKGKIYHNAYLS